MGTAATAVDVSRLFARAAFGATPADLDRWTGRPYLEAVEHLLAVPDPLLRPPQADEPRRILLENARAEQIPVRGFPLSLAQAQRWWLERMRTTPYPLEERMTLFWHDHFATAIGGPYPDTGMMMIQNQTLRRHALGNFRELCNAITVDPAMLYWLSGNLNTNAKPNENYGREFFELFTLGTIPRIYSDTNATPNDISEAARVFTGWIVDPGSRAVTFVSGRHDTRVKTVLGQQITNKGNKEHLEITNIALAQEVASRFVAYKIVLNFAYVPQVADLLGDAKDPLIEKVSAALRANDWDLKAGMRALLSADEFRYAEPAREEQVLRQPIDLVVSATKAIGISADAPQPTEVLIDMGQSPFEPPNVGGWPRGREWMSPVTTLARYNWGVACYNLWSAAQPALRPALPTSADLEGWARRFGLASLAPSTRQLISEYLAARASQGGAEAELQAGVLILIVSSPDWMVA